MMANARKLDPQTSHDAANSVQHLTQTQMGILNVLSKTDLPLSDERIIELYEVQVRHGLLPRASQSGIRSRRAELTELGLVEPRAFGRTVSGRRCTLWGLTNA